MRRAMIFYALLCCVGGAFADGIGFDFVVGGWALQSSRYTSYRFAEPTVKGGPMLGIDFRIPGSSFAYEAAFNYRRYNGTLADYTVMGLENRLPIYFTAAPLRVYAAPSLGLWQFKSALNFPAAYGGEDSDFAFSVGGVLGLRVVGAETRSYFDACYSYQGTKVTGPEGFFASRRIIRGKGHLAISGAVGLAIEAGTVEEGWVFVAGSERDVEYLYTYEAGSPYVMFGPSFSF